MYARGILFGKMKYELGDHSYVRCPENGLSADIEFKTKGYFGGTYNAIGGVIKNERTGESLYELSGMWSGEMIAKNVMVGLSAFGRCSSLLKLVTDRSEGVAVQCIVCEAHSAACATVGRAAGT